MIKKFSFLLTLSVVLFIVIVDLRPVNAQTSLDYYKGLFNSWGVSIDILPKEINRLDTPATKKDLQTLLQKITNNEIGQSVAEENTANINRKDHYLLLLASQSQSTSQNDAGISGYQNIIVVCDSLEASFLPQGVSCASNSLNFADQNPNESSVSNKILQTIQPVNVNGANYYLLPQVLLITPQYQNILGDYFKALSQVQAQASANIYDSEKIINITMSDVLKNLKNSSIFEITIYTLVILLFIVVMKKPITLLVRHPQRFLEKSLYVNQIHHAINFLTKNYGMTSFIFLLLSLFYIPILYTLSIKAGILGDPTYPIRYLTTTLNPLNIPNYLTVPNLFRIGLLFYHYSLFLFGILLIIPNLVRVSIKPLRNMLTVKLKVNFIKWLVPTLIILNGILLAFIDLKSLAGFLILSMTILLIPLFYLKSRRIEYNTLFSPKELAFLTATVLIVLSLNVAYPLLQKGMPIRYAFEPLIDTKSEVTALPYSKKWTKNVLFEPHYYSGSSKVFVDNYLIYAPNTQTIVNKSLRDFTEGNNGLIVSGNPKDTIETLLKNPKILPFVETNTFSPLFVLDNTSGNTSNYGSIKTQVTFNCDLSPVSSVIKLEIITLNKFTSEQTSSNDDKTDPINIESTKILNFPACNEETGSETFEVPFDSSLIPQERVILRLRGIDEMYLSNVKLLAGTTELSIWFLNKNILYENGYSLLYSSKDFSPEITAYSTKVKKEVTINVKTTEDGFDISSPINTLVKQNLLQNSFIIWSTTQNELIEGEK